MTLSDRAKSRIRQVLRWSVEWVALFVLAGIAADAGLVEVLVFAMCWGVLLAWTLRMGAIEIIIWVVTLSKFWRRPPDFRDPA